MCEKLFTLSRTQRAVMWRRFKQTDDHWVAERLHAILIPNSGLLRTDHQEVFNGFNRVTFDEWQQLAAEHGLALLGGVEPSADPHEDDLTLLRQPPFPHACIADAFARPPVTLLISKKVVLASLS